MQLPDASRYTDAAFREECADIPLHSVWPRVERWRIIALLLELLNLLIDLTLLMVLLCGFEFLIQLLDLTIYIGDTLMFSYGLFQRHIVTEIFGDGTDNVLPDLVEIETF